MYCACCLCKMMSDTVKRSSEKEWVSLTPSLSFSLYILSWEMNIPLPLFSFLLLCNFLSSDRKVICTDGRQEALFSQEETRGVKKWGKQPYPLFPSLIMFDTFINNLFLIRVVVSLRDLFTEFLSDYCLEFFTFLVPHSLRKYFFTQTKECCLNVLLKCKWNSMVK